MLAESRDRVRSMALIHEQLSHSGHAAGIEFGPYTERLVRYLLNGYEANPDRIQVQANVDAVLAIDQAMPCGLILQELLANSLKHAFPKDTPGEIHIEFHEQENELRLDYRDSGIGFPPGFNAEKTSSLGIQLISDLTAQLRGKLEYFNDSGARFQLRFPGRNRQR